MIKVHIATAREIGLRCQKEAKKQLEKNKNYVYTDEMNESDIFISVLYDKILTKSFLADRSCYNFHPGILPDYRGSGAFTWSILNKEKETGVTLHRIDPDIDSGPLIEIRKFLIQEQDTAYSLFKKAEDTIFSMFKEWFPKLLDGQFEETPQTNLKGKIYYRKDLENAKNITHMVKAFHFPGKESLYYLNSEGKKIYIQY